VRVKVSYFYKTLKIFNDFSRENHGRGGHEHGVHREVFGGKLSFKKMSAGGSLYTLQENPHFWVSTIKVRPPDCSFIPTKRKKKNGRLYGNDDLLPFPTKQASGVKTKERFGNIFKETKVFSLFKNLPIIWHLHQGLFQAKKRRRYEGIDRL
jgi:hypothetical protein